jgi:hypothetical protein
MSFNHPITTCLNKKRSHKLTSSQDGGKGVETLREVCINALNALFVLASAARISLAEMAQLKSLH